MKYKGIELIKDSEAELSLNVEATDVVANMDEDDLVDFLDDLLDDTGSKAYIDCYDDKEFFVRCDEIGFDEVGIAILKKIYDTISAKDEFRAKIAIHVDVEEWFKRSDGSEYNEDIAETWEEFMSNLEM